MSIPNDYTGYATWGTGAGALFRYFDNGVSSLVENPDAEGGWEKAWVSAWARTQYVPIDALPEGVPPCPAAPVEPKVQSYKAFVYDNDPITDFTSVEVSEDRKTLTLRLYEEAGELFELPFEDDGTNAGMVGAWVKALRRAADALEAWDEEHGE